MKVKKQLKQERQRIKNLQGLGLKQVNLLQTMNLQKKLMKLGLVVKHQRSQVKQNPKLLEEKNLGK